MSLCVQITDLIVQIWDGNEGGGGGGKVADQF